MKSFRASALVLLALLAVSALSLVAATTQPIPISFQGFIRNVGQWPAEVLYMTRGNGVNLWVTRTGTVVDLYTVSTNDGIVSGKVERDVFVGANARANRVEIQPIGTVSFFKGRTSNLWYTAPVFAQVVIEDAVPGVRVNYRYVDNQLQRTIAYNEGVPVGTFRIETDNGYMQRLEAQVASPVTSVVYGSFIGGGVADNIVGVKQLANGNVVVAGNSPEISFPGATGGYQTAINGTSDGFVARLDRKLERFLSYSYIGGSGDDRVTSIAVDNGNNVYVTGETTSTDLPITSGATGQSAKGGIDAFIIKLDTALAKLIVSGYHGGNKDDYAASIAVDQNGLIFLAGHTNSTSGMAVTFPAVIQRRDWWGRITNEPGGGENQGGVDGFVCFFSANGSIVQSRYFGREGNEFVRAMCIDKSNGVYLTGSTTSPNFETAPAPGWFAAGRLPYDRTFNGGNTDGFVVKLNNELSLAKADDGTYSTFFGGDGEDEGRGIYVDELGRAHVVGVTNSKNIDCIGTLVTQKIGAQDIYYGLFQDDGQKLMGATYFGGTGNDDVYGLTFVPSSNTAVLFGTTQSNDFLVSGEGSLNTREGETDGFIAMLNTTTNKFTTLVGGSNADTIRFAYVDKVGDLYIVGTTTSPDFPTNVRGVQPTAPAGLNAFVSKYAFGTLELMSPSGGETWCVGQSKPISWAALGVPDTMKFTLEISPAGANAWTEISKAATGRSLNWKVPSLPTGPYVVRVSTSRGHLSELTTPIFISNPPSISVQPKDASACEGGSVSLSMQAIGAGLKYQWRKAGNNISNATGDTLVIPGVNAATIGKYDCVVTGTCNPGVTSATVNVGFATPTLITKQPTAVSIDLDNPFTLSVIATGSDLVYQWKKNGANIAGGTAADYTVTKAAIADNGKYSCEVKGGCGVVVSDEVVVKVQDPMGVTDFDSKGLSLEITGSQPVADALFFRYSPSAGEVITAKLIDLQGCVLLQMPLGFHTGGIVCTQLAIGNLAPGTYFLQLISNSSSSQCRFIVR